MKLRNLRIQSFRGFDLFRLEELGRVNLIVGTNNSGKTTVLEAINILLSSGDMSAIWASQFRRGEEIWAEKELTGAVSRQLDIRRLFHGHEIGLGAMFRVLADGDSGGSDVGGEIQEYRPEQGRLFPVETTGADASEEFLQQLAFALRWSRFPDREIIVPISRRGGVTTDFVRRVSRISIEDGIPIRYVTASSLTSEIVTSLFEEIVLTPQEDLVIQALKIIDDSIERIASAGSERVRTHSRTNSRGGILVRCSGVKDRIPIGSMGDGIWRMLGLALALVETGGGILLVDEIDTGLHHSVMQDLWKLIYQCSKDFNIQVFATTHSRDCYESLAAICQDVYDQSDITIQRIERGRNTAIKYSEQEIIAAARFGAEVR